MPSCGCDWMSAQRHEHSLALPIFGIGVKTNLFQSCGHCWVFQICWHIECCTLIASSFRISSSSSGIHFSSPIPKKLMFTLAISCLITSNFPWFVNLTFQVPMQYCSLQHRALLLSPATSTGGRCFHFGSVSSFFLDLLLHYFSVAYWAPTDLQNWKFKKIWHWKRHPQFKSNPETFEFS